MSQPAPAPPSVVCLCGSSRFYQEFQEANFRETMAGKIVLSIGFYPHSQEQVHGEHVGITPAQKEELDQLHLRKIDLADEVLVLNVDGYIGQSTAREIEYAIRNRKLVRYLEPHPVPDISGQFLATPLALLLRQHHADAQAAGVECPWGCPVCRREELARKQAVSSQETHRETVGEAFARFRRAAKSPTK